MILLDKTYTLLENLCVTKIHETHAECHSLDFPETLVEASDIAFYWLGIELMSWKLHLALTEKGVHITPGNFSHVHSEFKCTEYRPYAVTPCFSHYNYVLANEKGDTFVLNFESWLHRDSVEYRYQIGLITTPSYDNDFKNELLDLCNSGLRGVL